METQGHLVIRGTSVGMRNVPQTGAHSVFGPHFAAPPRCSAPVSGVEIPPACQTACETGVNP